MPISDLTETNGEILPESITKVLSLIRLTNNDIFVDFGSGAGKVVLQVFLHSPVKEAYGIEILPELHQQAVHAAEKVPVTERKLIYLLGSFLEIPITTATIALVSATCFSPSLLCDLGKVIERTPSIHTVLSLRPIATLERLKFKKAIRIECSWDSALCYVYSSPLVRGGKNEILT